MSDSFNWRDHLKLHPAADMFPLMSESELKELADDIKQNGLQAPIVLNHAPAFDEANNRIRDERNTYLLDGRNRLDALALLGWLRLPRPRQEGREKSKKYELRIKLRPIEFAGDAPVANESLRSEYLEDDNEVRRFVIAANIRRRHLSADDKRKIIADLLKLQPETSNRTIAKTVTA